MWLKVYRLREAVAGKVFFVARRADGCVAKFSLAENSSGPSRVINWILGTLGQAEPCCDSQSAPVSLFRVEVEDEKILCGWIVRQRQCTMQDWEELAVA